ncbi:hypothetical protein LCGC14_1767760 [marine sediment metagenome]|uniref:Uncharacterized protein n=1 Tax=marine sediment metagenome TaxID=412755 RepID=A0A0F9JYW6_9ZZZZ
MTESEMAAQLQDILDKVVPLIAETGGNGDTFVERWLLEIQHSANCAKRYFSTPTEVKRG